MKIAYSHLVEHIQDKPTIEQVSERLFQLGHEHEIEGNIFDIEFTPNRGDCLSIKGLLRDLAVFYKIEFNQKIYHEQLAELNIDFENHSKYICPQISFLKLKIDKAPEQYKEYLENYFSDLCINKNNFFTDVSNYLSYETGQPTHCYDANKINNKLVFHELDTDEEFQTLLGKKIKLSGKNAVFSMNKKPINLAGVVGDMQTSCSTQTKTVIVECAYFQPEAIVGQSVKYDIQSEASHKFERGVDHKCQNEVLRRFIQIIREHTKIIDMSIKSYEYIEKSTHKIPVNHHKINQIIGIDISAKDYIDYLTSLGFIISNDLITVPSFRNDIQTQNDLAEEIARIIGYNNISRAKINIPKSHESNHNAIENKLRFFLLDNGFYEVINPPFVGQSSDQSIKVDNPLDSNRQFLRTNISNSLLDNLLYNERRQKESIKLFEISDIYTANNDMNKKRKLSIIASGRVGLNYEDFSKKINKKYLETLFKKICPNQVFDYKILSRELLDTKLKNEIVSLEIDIDKFSSSILSYKEISKAPLKFNQFNPISDLPSSFKDISYLITDDSKIQSLHELFLNYKNEIIKNIYIFDYYYNQKTQEIKIGFRVIFQSMKKTLTSSEIELIYTDIVNESLKIEGISIPGIQKDLWV